MSFLRRKTLAISACVLAISLLTACTPIARLITEVVEKPDGATLTYVLDSEPRGVVFEPGGELARGVVLILDAATTLTLTVVPEGVVCTVETNVADCRAGDVKPGESVFIGVSGDGDGVNGFATFRRVGASAVFSVFARLP